jgi:hypothetical protein
MENFLVFSGALALIVGLLAVIEGNLHCFGIMPRQKSSPWSLRHASRSMPAMRFLRGLWR